MPKVIDPRVVEGKKCRDAAIRKKFKAYLDDHRTVEFAISETIKAYGLSESTIMKIVKEYGIYNSEA